MKDMNQLKIQTNVGIRGMCVIPRRGVNYERERESERERERVRQTDRQTDILTQTDRLTGLLTDRQTGRQAY
jgi:hypothetical protein